MSRPRRRGDGDVPGAERHRTSGWTERGQAFTLEAFVASLLLLTTLVVVLGSTAVTPLSASGSSQQVAAEQRSIAGGVLDSASANGSLRPAVLFWNDSAGRYHGASDDGDYTTGGPPNEFGRLLNRSLGDRDIVYNVDVRYVAVNESVMTRSMVTMGRPSDSGVRAVRWVTLYDGDALYAADGTATNVVLGNSSTFYAPDVDPDGPVYNVVRVEVVAWRV